MTQTLLKKQDNFFFAQQMNTQEAAGGGGEWWLSAALTPHLHALFWRGVSPTPRSFKGLKSNFFTL